MEDIKFNFIKEVADFIKDNFRNIAPEIAEFIGCQFALESAFGRSNLAHNQKNYCGMKTPLVRISTAKNAGCVSVSDQFAKYTNLYDCVIDYILWLQFQKPMAKDLESINCFCSILRPYCPEKDYTDKIKLIYSQFKTKIDECTKSNSKG